MVDKEKLIKDLQRHFYIDGDISVDDQGQITVIGNVEYIRKNEPRMPNFQWQYVSGSFKCRNNKTLQTLLGSPRTVGEGFFCYRNANLLSLEGAPDKVGQQFDCTQCPRLVTLDHLPSEIGGEFLITYSSTLPVLRGLVAKGGIGFTADGFAPQMGNAEKVELIINKYKGQGKMAVFDCQKDLEDAGFPENARW
jgi:hypothetical protein